MFTEVRSQKHIFMYSVFTAKLEILYGTKTYFSEYKKIILEKTLTLHYNSVNKVNIQIILVGEWGILNNIF